jgi:hypothetical protein
MAWCKAVLPSTSCQGEKKKISILLKRSSLESLTVPKQSRRKKNNLHERSSLKAFFSLIFQAFLAFFSKLKGF